MIKNNGALLNSSTFLPRLASGVVVLLAMLGTGCAYNPFSASDLPPVPESQRNVDVDYDYIMGPGDMVDIFVWGNEELSSAGVVRPDGKLTTHLVEDLQASGSACCGAIRLGTRYCFGTVVDTGQFSGFLLEELLFNRDKCFIPAA